MVAMTMYYIPDKAPLTVPLYLHFAKAKYRYNGTVRGALSIYVGMLLTAFTEHRNKLHVGCHRENQCDETTQQSPARHQ